VAEPLVSIIIPVYNSAQYLDETIRSALNQTWPNKEIIIIDDGSADNSFAVAQKYKGAQVKVFSQVNLGASSARNKGLKEARGEYIQFLDADDLLSTDKITEQIKRLNQNLGKIAVCSTVFFKDGSFHGDARPLPSEEPYLYDTDDPVDFLIDLYGGYRDRGSMVSIHAWLVPKSIIDKVDMWNEELTLDDDGEFFCRAILNSTGIIKTDGFSYYRKYMTEVQSLSARRNKTAMQSALKSFFLKKQHLSGFTNSDAAKKAMYKQTLNLAIRTYLIYPDLYRLIKKELKIYPNYYYHPVLGGKFINFIARWFGWRIARFIQYYYNAEFNIEK
jgi:glycosyltransferase involved in cell wall biosynthesis